MGLLLPDRRSLKSPLAPAELVRVLRKNTGEPWAQWPAPAPEPLEGEVSDQGFKVRRSAWTRNAWRPWLEGTVEEVAGGAGVEVTIELGGLAAVYSWLWLAVGAVVAIGLLVQELLAGRTGSHAFVGFFFVVVGYAFMKMAYWYEVARSLGLLKELVGLQ